LVGRYEPSHSISPDRPDLSIKTQTIRLEIIVKKLKQLVLTLETLLDKHSLTRGRNSFATGAQSGFWRRAKRVNTAKIGPWE
jgi:hypothetical protein